MVRRKSSRRSILGFLSAKLLVVGSATTRIDRVTKQRSCRISGYRKIMENPWNIGIDVRVIRVEIAAGKALASDQRGPKRTEEEELVGEKSVAHRSSRSRPPLVVITEVRSVVCRKPDRPAVRQGYAYRPGISWPLKQPRIFLLAFDLTGCRYYARHCCPPIRSSIHPYFPAERCPYVCLSILYFVPSLYPDRSLSLLRLGR